MVMKRFIAPIFIFLTLGLVSCKKLVSFDINFNDNVTIPANSLVNIPFELPLPQNNTNSEQTSSSNGTSSKYISKVALTGLDLNIVNPSSANFNFLKSVEVFLSGPDLPEIRIAYNTDIPATGLQTVPLTCENSDLKEYIKKTTYTIKIKATTDENLTEDTEINIHSKLTADAGIF
jgi:hypothetical protein